MSRKKTKVEVEIVTDEGHKVMCSADDMKGATKWVKEYGVDGEEYRFVRLLAVVKVARVEVVKTSLVEVTE